MPKASMHGHIFVLWDENFDEVTAVLLMARLRKAAWRTYLVGVQSREATGRYGLRLAVDILLDKALHMDGILAALVLPCRPVEFAAAGDPRIVDLQERARQQYALSGARLVSTRPGPDAEDAGGRGKELAAILAQFTAADLAQHLVGDAAARAESAQDDTPPALIHTA